MSKTLIKKYCFPISTVILCAVLLSPVHTAAQSARKIERRGDASFRNKDYYSAAKWYASLLYDSAALPTNGDVLFPFQSGTHKHSAKVRSSHRPVVLYQLAESYRLCYHYKEALGLYEQYLATQDTKFPLAGMWYGNCLNANDEPEKALTAFNTFLKNHKTNDAYSQNAKLGIINSHFIIKNKSLPPQAAIIKMTATGSADGSNFALDKISDSSFWFTTSRHELNKRNEKEYPVRLYAGNFNTSTVEKIAALAAKDMNTGASSLSADGCILYFTGWRDNAKLPGTGYAIFYMKRAAVDSLWGTPVALPVAVNVTGFNSRQPFITRDGRYLFFSSDRPGGSGNYDIWVVNMDGSQPAGAALNLGTAINTNNEEASPFYDADSSCLYFSSDGREGMGGMDIYKVSGSPAGNQWSAEITNLGYPLNSVKNDLYYSKDTHSDTAYLSSDRASSCCLEIFKAARLLYRDSVMEKDTSDNNRLVITQRKPSPDSIAASENRRLMDSVDAITRMRREVYYNFASAKIRRTEQPVLDAIVKELEQDPALNILVASFTDCIGSRAANIEIARSRSESVRAYLLKKGIAPERINIDFFGKKYFVLPCKEDRTYNQQEQVANRRSDLILATEANPKWHPSGKELDIQETNANTGSTAPGNNNNTGGKDGMTGKNDKNIADKSNRSEKETTDKDHELRKADNNRSPKKGNTAKKRVAVEHTKKKAGISKLPQEKVQPVVAAPNPSEKEKVITRRKANTLTGRMAVTELLDFTPSVKAPDVVEQITRRIPRKPLLVYTTSDSVRIDLYDNGVFDYDSVSVIYNKKLVAYKEILQTTKPITFYVKLDADQSKNEMIFFAENLGLTPPNSALMIITDGEGKRTEVNVASDLEHNTVVYFIKVKK